MNNKSLLTNSKEWLSLEDLPNEKWKIVNGFNGMYYISDYGRVKSYYKYPNGKILRQHIGGNNGYLFVNLYDQQKRYPKTIHRLVGEAFIENQNKLPVVMHKDNNKENNVYTNLCWGTYSHNIRDGYDDGLNPRRKTILQFDENGVLINEFISITEASNKLKIKISSIANCLSGRSKKAGGYKWEYKQRREEK